LKNIVGSCNEVMRIEEDHLTLVKLERQLTWTQPDNAIVDFARYDRKLLKKGTVKKVTIREGRIVKAKDMELFLFTDMLMYAKPIRLKKPPFMRYEVRDQFKRAYVKFKEHPDVGDKMNGKYLMDACITGEEGEYPIHFRADSDVERARWLEAFNDRGTDVEGVYGAYDCPEVEVLRDYDAIDSDALSIRVGQRYKILENREGWKRGYNAAYQPNSRLNPIGWIPADYVCDVENDHSDARRRRERHRDQARLGAEESDI
jgi:hypothetical protein